MPAAVTPNAGESVGEHAAAQERAELMLHHPWHPESMKARLARHGEERRKVLPHRLVQDGALSGAGEVPEGNGAKVVCGHATGARVATTTDIRGGEPFLAAAMRAIDVSGARNVAFVAPFPADITMRFARAAARLDGVKLLGVVCTPAGGADADVVNPCLVCCAAAKARPQASQLARPRPTPSHRRSTRGWWRR